jgi:hypothetical protein
MNTHLIRISEVADPFASPQARIERRPSAKMRRWLQAPQTDIAISTIANGEAAIRFHCQ